MTAAVARVAQSTAVGTVVRLQRQWPLLQIVALAALVVFGAMTIEGFTAGYSIRSMLILAALLSLAALGQTLCFVIGALDLSVPGMIVMGAVVSSELTGTHGWPFLAAFPLLLAIAVTLGAFIGWTCQRFQANSIVVSLGVGTAALGGATAWTGARLSGSPPTFIGDLTAANSTTLGMAIPPIIPIWIAVAAIVAVALHRTLPGRHVYATGANPRAASLALIKTRRVWTSVFAVSAAMSAVVGTLLAGFSGANPEMGHPYLFEGLTAVIIGGTAWAGSRGDYSHTVIGALILTVLATILVGLGYGPEDQHIVYGVLILIVVAAYGRERKLRDRV